MECDKQASLNIARFDFFNSLFYLDGNYSKKLATGFDKKANNISEDNFRIAWYQSKLIEYGYDENGYSKWNLPHLQ